jgi:hypothetical protein
MLSRLGQQFTISQILNKEFSTDLCLSIHKRRIDTDYTAATTRANTLIAHASMEDIVADSNLSIVDRSTELYVNLLASAGEVSTYSGVLSLVSDTDRVLVTDVFSTATNSQTAEPLFYKHVIPTDHFDPTAGHKLISFSVLDSSLTELGITEYSLDEDEGVFYNNLENTFRSADTSYTIYYLRYSVKESATSVKSHTVLLSNENAFRIAEITDLTEDGVLINDGRKIYLLDELDDGTYELTFIEAGTYAVKPIGTDKLSLTTPASVSSDYPWYVRVNNGDCSISIGGATHRYYIAEILDQAFYPYAPYKFVAEIEGRILNGNIIKLPHNDLFFSTGAGIHVEALIYDSKNYLRYALTSDTTKHGTSAGTNVSGTDVTYSCLAASGATYGFRSVDTFGGFLDVQGINLITDQTIVCSYFYKCDELEIVSLNFNPLHNQEMIGQSVIVFVMPAVGGIAATKTIYSATVDRNGEIVDSDWPGFAPLAVAGKHLYLNDPPAWCVTLYGAANCVNFTDDYTVNGGDDDYAFFLLGEVYLKKNVAIDDIQTIDVRMRGGGLAKDSLLRDTEEAQRCLDIGYVDGVPYPGTGCYLVEVPIEAMEGTGGVFNAGQIREIVGRHTAYGVYPVIRGYGVDPHVSEIYAADGSIELVWSHASTDTYYNIYYSKNRSGPFARDNVTPQQENTVENSYVITGLDNNVPYYVMIVGGKYNDENVWVGLAGQIIGDGLGTAAQITSMEIIKCLPGAARNSNLLSQQFSVTI